MTTTHVMKGTNSFEERIRLGVVFRKAAKSRTRTSTAGNNIQKVQGFNMNIRNVLHATSGWSNWCIQIEDEACRSSGRTQEAASQPNNLVKKVKKYKICIREKKIGYDRSVLRNTRKVFSGTFL
ncbi:uncharacterized protein LOC129753636 [Uranotaenia lowii]|uniref:uncharacterized protein LOC129753636 n=1 Tax=Uranotaenia lowii TaxID=190385 RepID=UPI00247B03C1|nr:uncharacterized protein LOC129753636 [Uranotaenia lowii]